MFSEMVFGGLDGDGVWIGDLDLVLDLAAFIVFLVFGYVLMRWGEVVFR
jgi:hypothetical protein